MFLLLLLYHKKTTKPFSLIVFLYLRVISILKNFSIWKTFDNSFENVYDIMDTQNGRNIMILATSIIGIIYRMGNDFDDYLKVELKKREIPIEGKHAGLFMVLFASNNLKFKDIAYRWRKSKSTLCDILCKYSEQGLLEKVSCTLDKRHLYIRLTEEGLKYARDFDEIASEFLKKITSGLSEVQKKELKMLLVDMADNLKKNKFEKSICED